MTGEIISIALYQEVAERLRQRIYNQILKPGQWIDEQALAAEFGISRTPLREALKLLNAEGLVTLRPRRGCFVAEVTAEELDEIFPVMALLEGRCAYEAVRKATAAEMAFLDELHARLEQQADAGDIDGYYRDNYIFHEAVQKLAGNRWMERVVNELRKFLRMQRGRQLHLPGRLQASLQEHRQLMDAFHRRDAKAAERIMNDHLLKQRVALAAHDALLLSQSAPEAPKPVRRKNG
jgi:DNA-binding GntR family transcriptional regulator